jgi:hypothetical protein
MQHKILSLCISIFCFSALYAQTANERNAIKSLCGCFDVTFEYAETFARDTAYRQLAKPYRVNATEYVTVEEETPTKIVLQHLLVINDSTVIKHWRQDWEYQPARLFTFEGNRSWSIFPVQAKETVGQWAQKVYEVDDNPRYSGSATWFMQDGKQVWENTADAPLPRREYTKRSDYQVMRRTNRNIITEWGWLHEQDNEKVVRSGKDEHTLVEEKGLNAYHKTDAANCAAAVKWWKKNRSFWRNVRLVWDDVLAHNSSITTAAQVDGRYMGQELDELSKGKFANDMEAQKAIRAVLNKYLQTAQSKSNK